MSYASIRSLKLNAEETDGVRAQARELHLYEHGFLRNAVRLALGLPVPKSFRDHVARQIRAGHADLERIGNTLVG